MNKFTILMLTIGAAPTFARAAVQEDTLLGVPEAALTAFDAQPGDNAGAGVAIWGDMAIVPAQYSTADSGGLYLYARSGAQWSFDAKLKPDDGDVLFSGVATDGQTIVVGATLDAGTATQSEGVYVYELIAGGWTLTAKLTAQGVEIGDGFGLEVDVDGDTIIVGAPFDDDMGLDEGAAYVFERGLGVWQEQTKLFGVVGLWKSRFGFAVAIDGDFIAVGEPYYADDVVSLTNDGYFLTFERVAGNWIFAGGVHGAVGSRFGRKIALDGTILAVSAPSAGLSEEEPGFVSVYAWDGNGWGHQGSFTSSDEYIAQGFGNSLSVSGNRVVVCGTSRPLYVFEPIGSAWVEVARITGSENVQLRRCAIDGDFVLAADFHFDANRGRAFVYRLETSVGTTICTGDGAGAACPCGNESLAGDGGGCVNSTGDGGRLAAYGSASAANDDQVAVVSHVPPDAFTLLVAGTVTPFGGFGSPLGDGLRCLGGGTIVRFPVGHADSNGVVTWGPGLGAFAGFAAGETWYLQAYYRDPVGPPCGSPFNTTNARSLVFVP